jgi:catechol 2,3-dioxygenase-like lactoylglutathione lyase family enzyme
MLTTSEKGETKEGDAVITHIHSATLMVEDQDVALDFYVGKLDWEKRADAAYGDGSRWVEVGPPGAVTVLALVKPGDVGASPEEAGKYKGISLVTDDIDSTYATLRDRGVKFVQPPEQMPWGARATWFEDPDGNLLFLVEG